MSPDGEEVPVGKEGEVWIKGPNVFIGYLNNEAATSACKVRLRLPPSSFPHLTQLAHPNQNSQIGKCGIG